MPKAVLLRFVWLALVVALGGCSTTPRPLVAEPALRATSADAIAGRHRLFVATTRDPAADKRYVFSSQRSNTTGYARLDMSVPATHAIGRIERRTGAVADPARFFTATDINGLRDRATFVAALRADLARRDGQALLYIHGYRNNFDDAVLRLTQLAQDTGFAGTPVLFSWASAGRTIDYGYDFNSATAARDALEDTLRALKEAGATRIDVVAHSLGTWVTVEALRQLAIAGDRDLDGRLGNVVLASPDIDLDVFRSQMQRYGRPDRPFIMLVSTDDRALRLSSVIAGNLPRAGDYGNASDLAALGVVVADLSGVAAGDPLNHARFADNPALVRMLGERLRADRTLETGSGAITDRIVSLSQGVGQTLGSAAEIVITAPAEVVSTLTGR